jgi:Protein of unknown function (DUF4239)
VEKMNSTLIALVSAGCIFLGALLGLFLQRLLPGHHLNKETQDVVKLSAGTIATLTALVLGLLVSSAKNSFDTMSNGIVQSSAKIILLDRALARYGPETKAAREQFKRHVAGVMEMVWPAEKTDMSTLTAFERATGLELFQDKLDKLAPQNDAQRHALAQAQQIVSELGQTRWFLIEQEQKGLPFPLLVILVFWLTLLFVSFGLFAPSNATALTVLFLGACAISGAIFLVLELNQPLEGIIKVSSAPLRNALLHLNE